MLSGWVTLPERVGTCENSGEIVKGGLALVESIAEGKGRGGGIN